MAAPSQLSPVPREEPAPGSPWDGSGGLDEQGGHRHWVGNAASREGRHRASCSRADPRSPDNMSKQEFSGEKEQEALFTSHASLLSTELLSELIAITELLHLGTRF